MLVDKILNKEGLKNAIRIPTYVNAVYRVDKKFILKMYDSEKEWKNTLFMYKSMEQHGLSSPAILTKGKTPKPYIIMRFLDGKQIYQTPTAEVYRSFGEWVGKLHSIAFTQFGGLQKNGVGIFYQIGKGPFRRWKEMHLALVEERMEGFKKTILKPLVPLIRKFFKTAKYPIFQPVLLHGDLNGKNIFVNNGKVIGVIDPDSGFIGCAEEELMRIELDHFEGNENLRKAFFQGYLQHARLLPGHEKRRLLFRLSRTLVEAWCIIHLKKYKAAQKNKAMKVVYDEIIAIVQ